MNAVLKNIFKKCLLFVNPAQLIRSAITIDSTGIRIQNKQFILNKNCYLVGFGKAVYEMAIELESLIGDHLCEGIISVPIGMRSQSAFHLADNSVIKVFEGAKDNLPDENSFQAATCIKKLAERLKLGDIMIVLISGGGSALLSFPVSPITVEEKNSTIKMIANAGADIIELNTVRKELSELKGGKLAQIAYPATTVALILSDIVGDPVDFIASGPTVISKDFSTDTAAEILEKYCLSDAVPASVQRVVFGKIGNENVGKEPDDLMKYVHNVIIGNNSTALEAAKKEAEFLSYSSVILSNQITGLVSDVVELYIEVIKNICKFTIHKNRNDFINNIKSIPRQDNLYLTDLINKMVKNIDTIASLRTRKTLCLIAGGEPTVQVKGKGIGGRNLQLVLEMGIELSKLQEHFDYAKEFEISFLSAGTDGIDGPTDAAGAICDIDLINEAKKLGINAKDYVDNNDAYTFFSLVDDGIHMIKTGHTGTNVMDVHLILLKFRN